VLEPAMEATRLQGIIAECDKKIEEVTNEVKHCDSKIADLEKQIEKSNAYVQWTEDAERFQSVLKFEPF